MKANLIPHGATTLLLWMIITACSGSNSRQTSTETGPRSTPKSTIQALPDLPIAQSYSGQTSALQNAEALKYLPTHLFASILSSNPSALSTELETTDILKQYPEFYSELVELKTPNQATLASPETWVRAGVDASAPAGAALIIKRKLVFILFVTVSDKALFQTTLSSMSPTLPSFTTEGMSTIVRWEKHPGLRIILRSNQAFFVWSESHELTQETAQQIATLSLDESFAAKQLTSKSFSRFDFGSELAGFFSFSSIAEQIDHDFARPDSSDYHSTEIERLEQSLEDAIARGDDIASIESELDQQLASQQREALNQAGVVRATKYYLHSMATMPFGIDLDGQANRFRTQISPTSGSHISRLFSNQTGRLPMPKRLVEQPIFFISGHFRIASLLALSDPLFFFEGTTRKGAFKHLESHYGIDVSQWIALLDGELSFAVTLKDPTENSPEARIGIHGLAHLTNPAAAQTLLEKLAKHPALIQYASTYNGKIVLELPSFNEGLRIRIQVNEEYLEVRETDITTTTLSWTEEEQTLLNSPTARGIVAFDPGLLMLTLAFGMDDSSSHPSSGLSPDQMAEFEEFQTKRDDINRDIQIAYVERIRSGSDTFGRIVANVQTHEHGFAILGGLFSKHPHLGRALQTYVEMFSIEVEKMRTKKPSNIEVLRTKQRKLEDKMESMMERFYR